MKKISLHNAFFVQLVLVGAVSVILVGYLWVSSEQSKFEKEIVTQRNDYIQSQKDILKREATGALTFVKYMRSQTENRLKNSIRNRVYEAHSIATHIYQQNIQKKSVKEIKEMIKDALRPIKFKKGRGYYFAFDLNGVETLFPVKPEMEGKSMLQVTGGKGEFVVPDMLSLVSLESEGFYRYTWLKPGKEGFYPKIAFVKILQPIGWVIGTGEYLDDIEADIQKECIQWISKIQFGKDGYVFAGQWDGLSLSGPATGRNMYDVQDVNGVKIVQELISSAKAGGGFVEYVIPKFEGKKHAPKISYSIGVPEWKWYIGSGAYVDEIEDVIADRRLNLNNRIKTNLRNIVYVLICLLVLIIIVVKFLSGRIQKNLVLFTQFFTMASEETIKIKRTALHFFEFDQLAKLANHMIEKQRQSEKALHASHQRFLTVLDSIDATIYVADMDSYEILFMNKYMKEVFGGDLTGKICWDVFRNESGPCPYCSNKMLVDKNGNVTDVHVWQDKNPKTNRWYINYDRAIEWTDGRLVRLQIATDITDFKKMEDELRQAHKMESIGTLAGGIAHDFNNILSIIIGNVELALDDVGTWNPAHKNIKEIKTASLRAKDVVKQLLSFSRKSDQDWKTLDIAPVISESLKLIRSSIPSNIEIRQNIPERSPYVLADATQIHQVIINLCTNAAHSMADKEGFIAVDLNEINLETSQDGKFRGLVPGRYVELIIKDNGSGIDSELIDKIFDPYFTTKGVGEGTGMGLAVVHGIVKNHDGAIFVDSGPGKGTAFHLFFPVTKVKIGQQPVSEGEGPPGGTERILFVDDEFAITEMTEKVLKKLGYHVQAITSPEDALAVFEKNADQFDLVISDMTMPKMNGLELSEKIKAIRSDIPVVICTGHASLLDEEKFGELHISAVEMKPVSMSQIAKTIRKVLDEIKL